MFHLDMDRKLTIDTSGTEVHVEINMACEMERYNNARRKVLGHLEVFISVCVAATQILHTGFA